MVPNEFDVSPEVMNLVAAVSTLVLIVFAARFLRFLHELEGYARREDGRHELR